MIDWSYTNDRGEFQPHCDQCAALNINGVPCHEAGCPNAWRHPATGEPRPAPCWECGFDFIPEDRPHKYSICPSCANPEDFEEEDEE